MPATRKYLTPSRLHHTRLTHVAGVREGPPPTLHKKPHNSQAPHTGHRPPAPSSPALHPVTNPCPVPG
eukprot:6545966-Prymnesium_polylepis.1